MHGNNLKLLQTKPKVIVRTLGLISYQEAWDYQTSLMDELKLIKKWNRDNDSKREQKHYLLFCEHNPVYTLGKSGSKDHLLQDEETLEKAGFEYFKINRGGDITYHGPGQLTVYPIFDLDFFFHDVHKYVRFLEEVVLQTLDHFGLQAKREKEFTGVWLSGSPKRKICAIGVHMSRWITMHGLALNVNTDLSHFENIVPCGIQEVDKTVTSIQKELNKEIPLQKVIKVMTQKFSDVYNFSIAESN